MKVTMFRRRLRNESNSDSEHRVHKSEIGRIKPKNPERTEAFSDAHKIIEKIDFRRKKLRKRYGL